MYKIDNLGAKLRINDWVKFKSIGQQYVGRVTSLDIFYQEYKSKEIAVKFNITDDIEITMKNGKKEIHSAFYVEKITEDEAMLFLLEC